MKSAALNPRRLDVATFARTGAALAGDMTVASLQRLSESTCAPEDQPPGLVKWSAVGAHREVLGGAAQLRLRLQVQADVWLVCQRCLQPMPVTLTVDRSFRFARSDQEAEELDGASEEEDFLSLARPLDVPGLVEDELIMALPIVPRHETCPRPLLAAHESAAGSSATGPEADGAHLVHDEAQAPARPPPFAALGVLKRPRSS